MPDPKNPHSQFRDFAAQHATTKVSKHARHPAEFMRNFYRRTPYGVASKVTIAPREQWFSIGVIGAAGLWWYFATEDNRICAKEADAAGYIAMAAMDGTLGETTILVGKQDYGMSEKTMRSYIPHVSNISYVSDAMTRAAMTVEYAMRIEDTCLGR